MKKAITVFMGLLCCIGMTACGIIGGISSSIPDNESSILQDESQESSKHNNFSGSQTSIFRSLTVDNGDPITGSFDVYLSKTDAIFFYIESQEEMKISFDFTYTTHDQHGVTLGYYLDGSDDKTAFDLKSATDEAFDAFWTNQEVTLQKGMNVFYLSGDDVTCKMQFEISGADQSKFTYVGAFPRQEFVA